MHHPSSRPALVLALFLTTALGGALGAAEGSAPGDRVASLIAGSPGQLRTRDQVLSIFRRTADPAGRVAILETILRTSPTWMGDIAREVMGDEQAPVRAAAIRLLDRAWPTRIEDLDLVRAGLHDADPRVVQAATAMIIRIGDDGALPDLVGALDADATGAVRRALITLNGGDAGSRQNFLTTIHEAKTRRQALAGELTAAVAAGNLEKATAQVDRLAALRRERVEVGLLLLPLLERPEHRFVERVRSAIVTLGGPVADCLPTPSGGPLTPGSTITRIATPGPTEPPRDWGGSVVGGIILIALTAMTWMLLRAKPVLSATAQIAKATGRQVSQRLVLPVSRRLKSVTTHTSRRSGTPRA